MFEFAYFAVLMGILLYKVDGFQNKKFIVQLVDGYEHDVFHRDLLNMNKGRYGGYSSDIKIHQKYHVSFTGLSVSGSKLELDHLQSLNGVLKVVPDSRKSIIPPIVVEKSIHRSLMSLPTWGVDILDGGNISGSYHPSYSGANVDVYVVDTGLDTLHNEFQGGGRIIKNIYDAFSQLSSTIDDNTDTNGHGTHCAGTIGGKNVGVSKSVNLYGVRVLDKDGGGDTSDVLHALEAIHAHMKSRPNPAIITMSLGGPCDNVDCSKDLLNIAVERLAAEDVLISVASGNSACNACTGSPNGATSAFVVGAINQDKEQAYFSNFGKCIDVLAPGVKIESACSGKVCGAENLYLQMSGTSMACPHATGVLAQMVQKLVYSLNKDFSYDKIYDEMSCSSLKDLILMDPSDSVTRNLMLQIPKIGTSMPSCQDLGGTCLQSCNGNGVCLEGETAADTLQTQPICFCDPEYYGESCSSTVNPNCVGPHNTLNFEMTDSYGDGWTYSRYTIIQQSNGQIIDNAMDSLCDGKADSRSYCFKSSDESYTLNVTRGQIPSEVGWSVCGLKGGAPALYEFKIMSSTNPSAAPVCIPQCNGSANVLTLYDSHKDGWNNGYYGVYLESTSQQLYGGTLSMIDKDQAEHNICIPSNECVYVALEQMGYYPSEISFEISGIKSNAYHSIKLCVDENGSLISSDVLPNPQPMCSDTPQDSPISLEILDFDGLTNNNFIISIPGLNSTLDSGGFYTRHDLCLPDGCHQIQVLGDSKFQDEASWLLCGRRGVLPIKGELCIEKAYNLCYGLANKPFIKSYVPHHWGNYFFITHIDHNIGRVYGEFGNIHGVHELYSVLEDGQIYSYDIGFGRFLSDPSDSISMSNRYQWEFCGITGSFPASGTFRVINGSCNVIETMTEICPVGLDSQFLVKIDTYGDGWGSNAEPGKYIIVEDNVGVISTGSLTSGEYERESLCLKSNTCYTLHTLGSNDVDEMFVLMCGALMNGVTKPDGLHFCVNEPGSCLFDADKVDKGNIQDDDFPAAGLLPMSSYAPTTSPTANANANPTMSPTTNANLQTILMVPFNMRLLVSDFDDSFSFHFLEHAVRHSISKAFTIWDINVSNSTAMSPSSRNRLLTSNHEDIVLILEKGKTKGRKLQGSIVSIQVDTSIVISSSDNLRDMQTKLDFAMMFISKNGANNANERSDSPVQVDIDETIARLVALQIKCPARASIQTEFTSSSANYQTSHVSSSLSPPVDTEYEQIWGANANFQENSNTSISKETENHSALTVVLSILICLLVVGTIYLFCIYFKGLKKGGGDYQQVIVTGSTHSPLGELHSPTSTNDPNKSTVEMRTFSLSAEEDVEEIRFLDANNETIVKL